MLGVDRKTDTEELAGGSTGTGIELQRRARTTPPASAAATAKAAATLAARTHGAADGADMPLSVTGRGGAVKERAELGRF
jgi:hypothetical protein